VDFVQVKYPDTTLLQKFIDEAGSSLQSFRYFSKRSLETIKNHACTFLLMNEDTPVAYGHLDNEDGVVWLGVAVSEAHIGLGLGAMMMYKLIDFAKENAIPKIKLSVDNTNTAAIKMYEKLSFVLQEKKETFSFYELAAANYK
jgi:ribosomal protein S18 acetylase RimI-like enzyme